MSGPLEFEHDFFISHASEDQDAFVRPLAEQLRAVGYRVWYSEWALTLGDRLRQSIDRGLASSRFGIVVLSDSFFAKDWPRQELDGLAALEAQGAKRILPVWHGVDQPSVARFSPTLGDRLAIDSSKGVDAVVGEVRRATDLIDIKPSLVRTEPATGPEPGFTERLKQLMPRADSRIELQDLVLSTFAPVATELTGVRFDASAAPSADTIPPRIQDYLSLVLPHARGAAVAAEWANEDQFSDWIRVIQRLANSRPSSDGFSVWNNMRLLPAMTLSYACGLGAIRNGQYGTLWRVLTEPTVKERDTKHAACAQLFPFGVVSVEAGRTLPGKSRHHTPTSDLLLEVLQNELFGLFDDLDELELAFDEYEIWLALAYAATLDRNWIPLGRFAWNYRHHAERSPRKKFDDARFRHRILGAGAFDGDEARLNTAAGVFDEFVKSTAGQFF